MCSLIFASWKYDAQTPIALDLFEQKYIITTGLEDSDWSFKNAKFDYIHEVSSKIPLMVMQRLIRIIGIICVQNI